MKKAFLILLILLSVMGYSQTRQSVLVVPDTLTQFGVRLPSGSLVSITDPPSIYILLSTFEATDDMRDVFLNGNYNKIGSIATLNDLTDVTAPTPANWDLLRRNSTSNQWINVPLETLGDSIMYSGGGAWTRDSLTGIISPTTTTDVINTANFEYSAANNNIIIGELINSATVGTTYLTGLGWHAGNQSEGDRNTFVGMLSGDSVIGDYNTGIGGWSLYENSNHS